MRELSKLHVTLNQWKNILVSFMPRMGSLERSYLKLEHSNRHFQKNSQETKRRNITKHEIAKPCRKGWYYSHYISKDVSQITHTSYLYNIRTMSASE